MRWRKRDDDKRTGHESTRERASQPGQPIPPEGATDSGTADQAAGASEDETRPGARMIGYRELLVRDGRLVSPHRLTVWESATLTADAEPKRDNDSGVYAYTRAVFGDPMCPLPYHSIAAVELSGRVIEHDDGRLRASTATILALRLAEGFPQVRYTNHEGQELSIRFPSMVVTPTAALHIIAGLTGRDPLAPGYYGIQSKSGSGGGYHLAAETAGPFLARYPWLPPVDGTVYIEIRADGFAGWWGSHSDDYLLCDIDGRAMWVKATENDRTQIERDLLAYYEVPRLDHAL